MNALRKSLRLLTGKKENENCNGVLSLPNDLIEKVLDVKQDTTTNNISYPLEKEVLDDMLKSPCEKIREEYIPNIISSRKINLDAYINFLKFVKKNYYEFNISVIKVIYSRLEIEENKKKYTYGDDFKELYVDYVDFNNTGKADKIKKKYKKDYEPLSIIYNQSITIYDKLRKEKQFEPNEIKKKCERDIEMFQTKLKRLNYFLDSLKNIYNQLYSENYITTDKEGNPEIVNNERIKKKREKIVKSEEISEFEKRRKTIGEGVKYQINIQTGDIPHYYTFSKDLSITAKKNKQKAWDEFINNLGEEKKWLDNKEFGQLIAYKNRTISENYEQLLSKEGNKTEKALYYLVFKINELWNKKSDEDKQQFKIYIESQIKEKPNEEESVSSTVPTLKRVLLDTKDSLNNKEEKTESDEKILKLLTFLNIQSRNPNIQNILKDNVFNENSPKPYLYGGLGELKKLLKSEITSMNDIYDNVSNQEQEEKLENTGSKKKEKKDPRINQDLVINLQKELEKRGGIIEAVTGLSEKQKEEFKKEKKEKNQSQEPKKWKFYTEYEEKDFFKTLKNNKYGTLRRKSRVILKKRKSSRRIKNRRSTLRKR